MSTIKTSWADDVEELDQPKEQPPAPQIGEDSVDENGVRTIVEYITNDDGKKIKVRLIPLIQHIVKPTCHRLQGKQNGRWKSHLLITLSPREKVGQSSGRRKVTSSRHPLVISAQSFQATNLALTVLQPLSAKMFHCRSAPAEKYVAESFVKHATLDLSYRPQKKSSQLLKRKCVPILQGQVLERSSVDFAKAVISQPNVRTRTVCQFWTVQVRNLQCFSNMSE